MKKIIFTLFVGFSAIIQAQEIKQDSLHKNKPFVLDEVIVSTAFNKIQSQNVMKVEHSTVKELQQKERQP